jgi:hypothetical protein
MFRILFGYYFDYGILVSYLTINFNYSAVIVR